MYIKVSNSAKEVMGLELKDEIVVVIDVLRATSTMITALSRGIKSIKTFENIEEARKYKSYNKDIILGGERNAIKPDDFDCGNSPLEYLEFQGRDLALTTTNGTLALNNARGAKEILIMSFHNIKATVSYLQSKNEDIRFICAGTDGEFSLDDALCAGGAIKILEKSKRYKLDDMSKLLLFAYSTNLALIKDAKHYRTLKEKGFDSDLEFCLSEREYKFIAKVEDGKIVRVDL